MKRINFGVTTATNLDILGKIAGNFMENLQIGKLARLVIDLTVSNPPQMNPTSPFTKVQMDHHLKLLKSIIHLVFLMFLLLKQVVTLMLYLFV